MVKVLFNPISGNGGLIPHSKCLETKFENETYEYIDVLTVNNMQELVDSLTESDILVITGGDGTLNKFVNMVDCDNIKVPFYYYPSGTGNDFYNDTKKYEENGLIKMNDFVRDLPICKVNGKTYKFLNGVGYGIDGYCCEEGDKQKALDPNSKVNYTSIAIKGLLFKFKPSAAKVVVDGVEHYYKKAWLCPTMKGKFYGGGMMITPSQDRTNSEKTVGVCVAHTAGKLKLLTIFPSIFKGEHTVHTDIIDMFQGHEVFVEFEKPCALQVDGETVLNVKSYKVSTGVKE